MLRRLGILVPLAALTVAAIAPVAGAAELLDRKKLATQVGTSVAATYPDLPVAKVSCAPKKVKIKAGATATCTVTAGTYPLEMLVTVVDKKGNVTIVSTQAVIPKANAEFLVSANSTLPVTAGCGTEAYLVRKPGEPFTCTATFGDGTTQQVTVTPTDVAGNATISGVS